VRAASVPGCRLDAMDGFRDKGETAVGKLFDLLEVSTGETWGGLSSGAVAIDGLTELV
jgi:hypothetical protein